MWKKQKWNVLGDHLLLSIFSSLTVFFYIEIPTYFLCVYFSDDDSIDNNAVEQTAPSAYDEQQAYMNFYTEDNNLNKVPQSKLGTGDAVLSAALLHHQQSKMKNGTTPGTSNGHSSGHSSEYKQDNFAGLPTTEI